VGCLIVLAVIAAVGRQLILGDQLTTETPKDTISDQVSQSLTNPLSPDTVPLEGKDFKIEDKKFFENNTWLVATVVPTEKNAADPATIVMKLENGAYIMVLGPGTAFPLDDVALLPPDVIQYLRTTDRVSEAIRDSN
jgi:hypothetical protein